MKKLIFGSAVVVFSLILASCNKEDTPEEKNSAEITITGPLENDTLHMNDTLKITGSIISTLDMHGYNASVRRTDDHTEVFYWDDHYHGTDKNLNITWPCNVADDVQLELKVTAVLDHEGDAVFKTVKFFCRP